MSYIADDRVQQQYMCGNTCRTDFTITIMHHHNDHIVNCCCAIKLNIIDKGCHVLVYSKIVKFDMIGLCQ